MWKRHRVHEMNAQFVYVIKVSKYTDVFVVEMQYMDERARQILM